MNAYTRTIGLLVASALLVYLMVGCGKKTEAHGTMPAESTRVTAEEILKNPEQYNGKVVSIEGRISAECPSGCWFDMTDGNSALHVDLNPSGLAIPQHVGKEVRVVGTVAIKAGTPQVIGQGVEIR